MQEENQITFETACDMAYNYYKDNFHFLGIRGAFDIGDSYVFVGGAIDQEYIGGPGLIAINKKDGERRNFLMSIPPSGEDYEALKNGTKMTIDQKYIVYSKKAQ